MSRIRAGAAYLRHLGPAWALYRAQYAAELRTGLVERRTPQACWGFEPERRAAPTPVRGHLVHVGDLRHWHEANGVAPDAARIDRLRAGSFDVFGAEVRPESWHHDPISGVTYPSDVHWTKARELPGVDVKLVWEPARFTWAFELARAGLAEPGGGAGALFWEMFEAWCWESPPNTGVHWACGQEAAIRLFAVAIAGDVLAEAATGEQAALFEQFVDATARRILANIPYARSQQNNHWTSEAVGLLATAAIAPWLSISEESLQVGLRELDRSCTKLVMPDGGTSQYSLNYHRVFIADLVMAAVVARHGAFTLPASVTDALERATALLGSLIVPATGDGPWFGSDDGADVLPLARAAHHDLRPTVQLASAALGQPLPLPPGPWDEAVVWLFGSAPLDARAVADPGPGVAVFADAGVAAAQTGPFRCTVRGGPHRFRPSHADQLHVDVWFQGVPVAVDAGTFSYKAPGWDTEFAATGVHNTVTVDGRSQMDKISRFFWAPWSSGHVGPLGGAHGLAVEAEHDGYVRLSLRVTHRREVHLADDGVLVIDRLEGTGLHRYRLHWLLADAPFQIDQATQSLTLLLPDGPFDVAWDARSAERVVADVVRADPASTRGWRCTSYRQKVPALSLAIEAEANGGMEFTTWFGRAGQLFGRLPKNR